MIQINLLPPGTAPSAARIQWAALPWRRIGMGVAGFVVVTSVGLVLMNSLLQRSLSRLQSEWDLLAPEQARWQERQALLNALRTRQSAVQSLKAPEGLWAPRLNLLLDALVSNLWFEALVFQKTRSSETREFLRKEMEKMGMSEYLEMLPEEPQEESQEEPVQQEPPSGITLPPELAKHYGGTQEGVPAPTAAPSRPGWRPRVFLSGSALMVGKEGVSPVTRFLQKLKEHPSFQQWFTAVDLKDVAQSQQGGYEVSEFVLLLYPTGAER